MAKNGNTVVKFPYGKRHSVTNTTSASLITWVEAYVAIAQHQRSRVTWTRVKRQIFCQRWSAYFEIKHSAMTACACVDYASERVHEKFWKSSVESTTTWDSDVSIKASYSCVPHFCISLDQLREYILYQAQKGLFNLLMARTRLPI